MCTIKVQKMHAFKAKAPRAHHSSLLSARKWPGYVYMSYKKSLDAICAFAEIITALTIAFPGKTTSPNVRFLKSYLQYHI